MRERKPPTDLLQHPEAVRNIPYYHKIIEKFLTKEYRAQLRTLQFIKRTTTVTTVTFVSMEMLSVQNFRSMLPVIKLIFANISLFDIAPYGSIYPRSAAQSQGSALSSIQIGFRIVSAGSLSLSLKTNVMNELIPFLPIPPVSRPSSLLLRGNPGLSFLEHVPIDVSGVRNMELYKIDRFPDLSRFSSLSASSTNPPHPFIKLPLMIDSTTPA